MVPKIKIHEKSQISFCKILKNKWYQAKILPKRFHLNGHTIGFCQQTQKLVDSGNEMVDMCKMKKIVGNPAEMQQ